MTAFLQHKKMEVMNSKQTLVLGISGVLDSLAHTIEWPGLAALALNVYLLLAPVWAIWVGIRWLRKT